MSRNTTRPTPFWPGPGNRPADGMPPRAVTRLPGTQSAAGPPRHVRQPAGSGTWKQTGRMPCKAASCGGRCPAEKTPAQGVRPCHALTLCSCLTQQTGSVRLAEPPWQGPALLAQSPTGRFSSAFVYNFVSSVSSLPGVFRSSFLIRKEKITKYKIK